jgi:hypothetical protein
MLWILIIEFLNFFRNNETFKSAAPIKNHKNGTLSIYFAINNRNNAIIILHYEKNRIYNAKRDTIFGKTNHHYGKINQHYAKKMKHCGRMVLIFVIMYKYCGQFLFID